MDIFDRMSASFPYNNLRLMTLQDINLRRLESCPWPPRSTRRGSSSSSTRTGRSRPSCHPSQLLLATATSRECKKLSANIRNSLHLQIQTVVATCDIASVRVFYVLQLLNDNLIRSGHCHVHVNICKLQPEPIILYSNTV